MSPFSVPVLFYSQLGAFCSFWRSKIRNIFQNGSKTWILHARKKFWRETTTVGLKNRKKKFYWICNLGMREILVSKKRLKNPFGTILFKGCWKIKKKNKWRVFWNFKNSTLLYMLEKQQKIYFRKKAAMIQSLMMKISRNSTKMMSNFGARMMKKSKRDLRLEKSG